jgi:hypothetical protein
MSRSGSRDRIATCSIRSMSRLNPGFRVSIPDLRKESPSFCSRRKRAAIRSYLERSRSMSAYVPAVSPSARDGGDVWMSLPGTWCDSARRKSKICAMCVPW